MKKRRIFAVLLGVTALAAATQLLPPAYARQQSTATWTAELTPKPPEAKAEMKIGLFAEGDGQTVVLSKDQEYQIEMELWLPEFDGTDLTTQIATVQNGCDVNIDKLSDTDKYIFTIKKSTVVETAETEPSATLTWTCGERVLSTEFKYIDSGDYTAHGADEKEEFVTVSTQYNEAVPINFTVGKAPVRVLMNNEEFPPLTRYTENGKWFVLYDGGAIETDADVLCSIDLSMTDVREDITLTTGDGTAEVEYNPFPTLDRSGAPFIMDAAALELPVRFMWGDVGPSVKIYRLTATAEGGAEWQEYDKITAQTADDGNIQLMSDNSPAGTYKIEVTWHSCHTIETNFYIRCKSIGEEVRN